jgi:hypothetical protein
MMAEKGMCNNSPVPRAPLKLRLQEGVYYAV